MEKKVVKVGEVGVDADLIWIGDPCYIFDGEERPKDIGKELLRV